MQLTWQMIAGHCGEGSVRYLPYIHAIIPQGFCWVDVAFYSQSRLWDCELEQMKDWLSTVAAEMALFLILQMEQHSHQLSLYHCTPPFPTTAMICLVISTNPCKSMHPNYHLPIIATSDPKGCHLPPSSYNLIIPLALGSPGSWEHLP